jgi:uncharacterized protein
MRTAPAWRAALAALVAVIAAMVLGTAGAAPAPAAPVMPAFPAPEGYVSDFAHVLDAGSRAALESRLAAYDRATTNQIAIALFANLGGAPVDEFTVRLEEAWKVGRQGRDNGILLVAAMEERQLRIEVGYGLEGKVTDADAGRIIRDDIAPAFRVGRYADGLNAAVNALTALIGAPDTPAQGTAPPSGSNGVARRPPDTTGALPGILFLCFVAFALFAGRRAGSRRCPRCGAHMQLVSQSATTAPGVGRVEAWACPRCGYRDKRLVQRPAIVPVPYAMGGGWGSGGFGGGGFGGFGGGSSGGGGASGGW